MKPFAFVATRKGLFSVDDAGEIAETGFVGDPVTNILVNEKHHTCYAALDLGHFGVKLHRSDDFGVNWTEVCAPAFPEVKPEAQNEIIDNPKEKSLDAKAPSVELLWQLAFACPDDPNRLWAGTIPGGLFYSEDGGQSWSLNQPLWEIKQSGEWFGGGYDEAGIHSICVDPRDNKIVRVAISCGGVWETRDGGISWTSRTQGMRAEYMPPEKAFEPNIQDPHCMVQCVSSPDNFWVQHHNGIFKSTDNTQTWQECEKVSPSAFGFVVCVHPNNPKIAWFVPGIKDESRYPVDAKLIVNKTYNGGQSFEALFNGLPNEKSYDLIYRHAMDVCTQGENLLMGSTTGNVWLSKDGGENWRCLSNYLPPVYAVKII